MDSVACRGVGDKNWKARREREQIRKKIDFFNFSMHLIGIPMCLKSLMPKLDPLVVSSCIGESQRFKKLAGVFKFRLF